MIRQCQPRWTNESFTELFLKHLGEAPSSAQVFVETLDGNPTADHLAGLLRNWGIKLENPKLPIVGDPAQLVRLVDDGQYFPGYDTVWFLDSGAMHFALPEFMTWYAAEGEGSLVKSKSGPDYIPWSSVSEWMHSVGAYVGLSLGHRVLEICLSSSVAQIAPQCDDDGGLAS
jgi:hypothetical protein